MATYQRLDYAPSANWNSADGWNSATGFPTTSGDIANWGRTLSLVSTTAALSNVTINFPNIMGFAGAITPGVSGNNITFNSAGASISSAVGTSLIGYGNDFIRSIFNGPNVTLAVASGGATIGNNAGTFTWSGASTVLTKTGLGQIIIGPVGYSVTAGASIAIRQGFLSFRSANALPFTLGASSTIYSLAKAPILGLYALTNLSGRVTIPANTVGVIASNTLAWLGSLSGGIALNNGSYLNLTQSESLNISTYLVLANSANATINVTGTTTTGGLVTIASFGTAPTVLASIRFDGSSTPTYAGAQPGAGSIYPYIAPTATLTAFIRPIISTTALITLASMTTPTNAWSASNALTMTGSAWANFIGKASAVSAQTFAGLTLGETGIPSHMLLAVTPNTAASMVVNIGAITRTTGLETVGFLSTVAPGAANGVITTTTNTHGIIGGWATMQSSVPADVAIASPPDTWAVYNAASGITGLSSFTTTTTAGTTTATYANANIQQTSTISGGFSTTAMTPNSWLLSTATTILFTGPSASAVTNTIGSGGILYRSIAAGGSYTWNSGTIRANNGALYIHVGGSTTGATGVTYFNIGSTIANPVSGTGAVVFAGKSYLSNSGLSYYQRVLLTGTNTYTGGTYIQGGVVETTTTGGFGSSGNITLMSTWTSTTPTSAYLYGSQLGFIGSGGFTSTNPITVLAYLDPPALHFRRSTLVPSISGNSFSNVSTYALESRISAPVFDYSTGTLTMSPTSATYATTWGVQPRGLVISLLDGGNANETSTTNWIQGQWVLGSQVNYSANLTLNTNSYFRVVGTAFANLTWAPKVITANLYPMSVILAAYSSLRFDATNTSAAISTLNIVSNNQLGSAIVTPASALTFSTDAASANDLSLFQTTLTVIGSNFSKLATGVTPLAVAWIRSGASLIYGQQNIISGSGASYNIEGWGALSTNGGTSTPNATGYIVARNNAYFQAILPYNNNTSYTDQIAMFCTINGRIQLSSGNTNNYTNFNAYNGQTLQVKAGITEDATGSYSPNYFAGLGAVFVSGTNTHTGTPIFVLGGAATYGQNIVVYSANAVGGPQRPILTRGAGNNSTSSNNSGTFLLWNTITNPIQLRGGWFTFAREGTSGNWGQAYNFPSWTNTYTMSSAITSGNVTDSAAASLPTAAFAIQSGVTLNFTGSLNFSGRSVSNTFVAGRLAHQQTTINFSGTYVSGNGSSYGTAGTVYAIRVDNSTDAANAMPVWNWSATSTTPNNYGTITLAGGYHKLSQTNGLIRSGQVFASSSYTIIDLNGYNQTLYSDGSASGFFGGTAYMKFGGATFTVGLNGSSTSYTLFTGTAAILDGAGTGTFALPTSGGAAPRSLSLSNTGVGLIRGATITGPLKHVAGTGINLENVTAAEIWSAVSGASLSTGTYLQGTNTISILQWWANAAAATAAWISNESAINVSWNSGVNTITSLDFTTAPTGSQVLLIKPNSLATAPFTTTTLSVNSGQNLQIAMNAAQLRDVMSTASYPLITVTGSASSNWQNEFSFAADQTGSTRLTRTLSLVGNTLTATLGVDRSVWTAATNSSWDAGTNANWSLQSSPGTTTFANGDCVLFDDTGTGTVTVTSAVSPALINFNNSSVNYSLSASGGSITEGSASGCAVIYKAGSGSVYWAVPTSASVFVRPGYGIYVMGGTFKHDVDLANSAFTSVYIDSGAKYVLGAADAAPTPAGRTFYGTGGTLAIDPHMLAATAGRTINMQNFQWDQPRSLFNATLSFDNTAGGATVNGSYAVSNLSTTVNFQSNITIPSGVTFITRGTNSYYPNDWTVSGAGLGSTTASIAVQSLTGLPYCGSGALSLAANSAILGNITMTGPTKISGLTNTATLSGAWAGYLAPSSNDLNVGVITGSISGNYNLTIGRPASLVSSTVVLAGYNTYVGDTWIGDEITGATVFTLTNTLIIGAHGNSGTLGTGTVYINAAGSVSQSELCFNRTDSYTLPGSIRAYSATASHGALLSIDTGEVITAGNTVNLTDIGGSGRVGTLNLGRNGASYADTRTLTVSDGTALVAGLINFNNTLLAGQSTTGTYFGGSVSGGGVYGSGTLNITGTSSVTGNSITVGAVSLNGSLTNGKMIQSFTGNITVTDSASLTVSGAILAASGQSLNITVGVPYAATTATLTAGSIGASLGGSVTVNLYQTQLTLTSTTNYTQFASSVWNLYGGPTITLPATGFLCYSQITGPGYNATIRCSTAGGAINLLSVTFPGYRNAGSITGGTLTFDSSVGTVSFYATQSFTNISGSATNTSYFRNNNITLISSTIAGSPTGFTTIASSARYKFSGYNTTTSPLTINNYSVVEFAYGTQWLGAVTLSAGGTLTGYGATFASLVLPAAVTTGTGIDFDGYYNFGQAGHTVTGAVTGTTVGVLVRNLPYLSFASPAVILGFGSTALTAAAFVLQNSSYIRFPGFTVTATQLQLNYVTQTCTWTGGSGTWTASTGSPGSWGGTYNTALMGDIVQFTAGGATITLSGYVNPYSVTVGLGSPSNQMTFAPHATNGGGIFTRTLDVISGKLIFNTKNNDIVVVNVYSTLETTYRNALYSTLSFRINYGGTFTPTDATSVNGTVFALETGSLYLDDGGFPGPTLTF